VVTLDIIPFRVGVSRLDRPLASPFPAADSRHVVAVPATHSLCSISFSWIACLK
jgi:hypothetical protein